MDEPRKVQSIMTHVPISLAGTAGSSISRILRTLIRLGLKPHILQLLRTQRHFSGALGILPEADKSHAT